MLIHCPDCEKEVSSRARACPQCAYPVEQLTNFADAIKERDAQMIQDLIRAGIQNVSDPDPLGTTPLMLSCQQKTHGITKLLLDAGADVNQTRPDGYTALMDAVNADDPETVGLLLEHGADHSHKNEEGFTALDVATRKKKTSVVPLLRSLLAEPLEEVAQPQEEIVQPQEEHAKPQAEAAEPKQEATADSMVARNGEQTIPEIDYEQIPELWLPRPRDTYKPGPPPIPPPPLPTMETAKHSIQKVKHSAPSVPVEPPVIATDSARSESYSARSESYSSLAEPYVDDYVPTEEKRYHGPGLICAACESGISVDDIWCPNCKGPIIKRYCGSCSELIPDNAGVCPLCSSSKVRRFRYIRHMEQIVVTAGVALFLFLFSYFVMDDRTETTAQPQQSRAQQSAQLREPSTEALTEPEVKADAVPGIKNSSPQASDEANLTPQDSSVPPPSRELENEPAPSSESSNPESRYVVPDQRQESNDSVQQETEQDDAASGDRNEEAAKPEVDRESTRDQAAFSRGPSQSENSAEASGSLDSAEKEDSDESTSWFADARRLNNEGYRLMQNGHYSQAIPVLARALRAFPSGKKNLTYAYALFNLGRSLRLAGRPDLAIPILEERMRFTNQREVVAKELQLARKQLSGSIDPVHYE